MLLKLSGDVEENPVPDEQKLDQILSTVTEIKATQTALQGGFEGVQFRLSEIEDTLASLKLCNEKVQKCEESVVVMHKELFQITKRLDALENRSRRNNIVTYGLKEENNESASELQKKVENNLLRSKLEVQVRSIKRIHRVGRKDAGNERPVILRFYDFTEKVKVFQSCHKLKNSGISISENFSVPVREIRRKLWQSLN